MQKKLFVIISFFILGTVLYLSVKLRKDEADDLRKTGIKTIGTVVNVGWKTYDLEIIVKNKSYSITKNVPYLGFTTDEQFNVLYDSVNPNKNMVLLREPIIDTIKYSYNYVRPFYLEQIAVQDDEIKYSYNINGSDYTRIQCFYNADSVIAQKKKLKVKYRTDKPAIGYLVEL